MSVVETRKRMGNDDIPGIHGEVIDAHWLKYRHDHGQDIGVLVTINGHERFATIGACGEAAYLFDTQVNAQRAYYNDREDEMSLAVVPLDDDWLETASITLAAKGL